MRVKRESTVPGKQQAEKIKDGRTGTKKKESAREFGGKEAE